jgi:hypothetical protein
MQFGKISHEHIGFMGRGDCLTAVASKDGADGTEEVLRIGSTSATY